MKDLRDTKINVEMLAECLRELSDRSYQERVWAGSVPGLMSTFVEATCTAFDDTGLSRADRKTRAKELGPDLSTLIERLDAAVQAVDQRLPVQQLVASEPMQEVRTLSRRILESLEASRAA